MRYVCLASGNGTTFQALWKACNTKELNAEICLLLSNRESCGAVAFARKNLIPTVIINETTHSDSTLRDHFIRDTILQYQPDFVLLLGYLKRVGNATLQRFKDRIINIHPSLLPKYGGPGMYGIKVHEAVIQAKESTTGITIHWVDEFYDHGRIIAQMEIPIRASENSEELQRRILPMEHHFLIKTLKSLNPQLRNGLEER